MEFMEMIVGNDPGDETGETSVVRRVLLNKINHERLLLGKPMSVFAESVGVDVKYIARILAYEIQPSSDELRSFAGAVGVDYSKRLH